MGRGLKVATFQSAPRLGLIARVGDSIVFLGSSGALPEGMSGDLYLCVNVEPEPLGLRGAFQVVVARDWSVD